MSIFDNFKEQPLYLDSSSIPKHYSIWGNNYNPKYKLKPITNVILPDVSTASGSIGPIDIETSILMDCTLEQALIAVENAAYDYFHARGEDSIEKYVITDIIFRDNYIIFERKKICE